MALMTVVLAVALGGCRDDEQTLLVSAASSLTEAFAEVAEAFETAHDGVTVDLNFGSSAALASQVIEGAPVDIFASANEEQMAALVDAGLASDPAPFATNRLVVVTPVDSPVQAFEDIARPGVRLVLAASEVPAGAYAREAIAAAGLEVALANVLSEEPNVRAVLTRIELGEADAGIVYETDARASGDRVRVVPIPAEHAFTPRYVIAALGEPPSALAEEFVEFVRSEGGHAILAQHGFAAP